MRTHLSFRTLTLAAFQTLDLACAGSMFYCKEASALFKLSFNGESPMDVESGWQIQDKDYTRLLFTNPTAAAIDIAFFYGTANVSYTAPVSIMSLVVRHAPTYPKGTGLVILAPGAADSYTGLDGDKERRQIVVSNLSQDNEIYLTDADDAVLAVIPPGNKPWTIEVGGTVKVKNPAAADISYVACETFYS